MQALKFWKAVTRDDVDLLDNFIAALRDNHIRFCTIGGQAVNAYVEPLVSLDLDLVIAVDQLDFARSVLKSLFHVEEFGHSINSQCRGPISVFRSKLTLDILRS